MELARLVGGKTSQASQPHSHVFKRIITHRLLDTTSACLTTEGILPIVVAIFVFNVVNK